MPHVVLEVPSLVILCGPASSGKSTFAAKHFLPTMVVSSDRCRAMIADEEANIAVSREAFALFHQIIDARLQYGRLAVADSTAVQPDARRALIRIARRRRVPTTLVVFNIPEELALRWDAQRARHVPPAVIHQHWVAFHRALGEIDGEGHRQIILLDETQVNHVSVSFKPQEAERVRKLPQRSRQKAQG